MVLFGELVFNGSQGWLWMAAALVAVMGLLAWSYRSMAAGPWRWFCLSCKFLALGLLVFCLLDPIWVGRRAEPGSNLMAVVVDNSEGLQVRDRGESLTRGEQLYQRVGGAGDGWLQSLEEQFEVRRYLFDRRLRTVPDFAELDFSGRASALHGALASVRERLTGRPLAGILLFTDGNATDSVEALGEWEGLPPIYPVMMGRPGAVRDLAIAHTQATQTAFEDAPIAVRVEVAAVGFSGKQIRARLLNRAGETMHSQTARARGDLASLPFQFEFAGEKTGVGFYQVAVDSPGLLGAVEGDESSEATLVNNRRVMAISHGRGAHRVLYVTGRPNWEFKFLNRALQEDDQLQMVALIRVAMREPKFEFRGRGGESSNPLYRGFGDQAPEDVEQYDQPVLVRLYTRDELELSGGFPLTAEDLYAYEAVILDDLEAEFFTVDQANLLRRFVSERGGGLLMLGGAKSFREGGYARSPIGETLPLYLDRSVPDGPIAEYRLQLSREGWLQAWARLRDNDRAERERLEGMPPFQVLNRVDGVKPGASVIGVVEGEGAEGIEQPALVTQRYGRGRTACLLIGDLWRWGMRDAEAREDLNQAWRQLARWLVADVPGRAEVAAVPMKESSMGVELQTRVRDAAYEPVDDAVVNLEIQRVALSGGEEAGTIRLRAEPSLKEAGLYEAAFAPRDSGAYEVRASVTNAAGVAIHRVESGWVADPANEEFRSLEPNEVLLEELARRSGGEMVSLAELVTFVGQLPRRSAPVMEAYSAPAWHRSWLFALALVLFVLEWGVRRWKGMP